MRMGRNENQFERVLIGVAKIKAVASVAMQFGFPYREPALAQSAVGLVHFFWGFDNDAQVPGVGSARVILGRKVCDADQAQGGAGLAHHHPIRVGNVIGRKAQDIAIEFQRTLKICNRQSGMAKAQRHLVLAF